MQCIFVLFAICLANCLAAIAEPAVGAAPDVELDGVVGEKKTEKRGIYGFGYGHYGHGGYGGYGGHGHAYGGYGGYGPYYGGYEYVHHAAPYYGHHGVYPYHHGHYGFY
ncbi:CG17777 [Drosophila busckii]|uniref:CG17777 n=1 Tax=Drosophila busckii TaxID=30019 RepID=A0A0M4EY56_DROBS|nr:CG17777 [Drosophila busckii]